jgi:quercetin dioxygenase-like cupin family protein
MVAINQVGIIRNYFAMFSERLQDPRHRKSHGCTLAGEPIMEKRMNLNAVIRMPGEAKGVELLGHPMSFLVTAENTKHTSMFDWMMPPRFSTGLHVHRTQEETFYVVDGKCEWQVGDRHVRATPGAFLFIPPGVLHNIANATDKPTRVLMTVSPPGHENYFEELAKAVTRDATPDAKVIAELRRRYDTDQISTLKN